MKRKRNTIPLFHSSNSRNSVEKPRKLVPYPPPHGKRDSPRLLIVFPVELPPSFFEELECEKTLTQFVAFHFDPRGRLLRENGMSIKPCPNEWVLSALLAYDPVAQWLRRNRIDLGTGRHWLLFDCVGGKSYVADPQTAMQCLDKQALPRKPKASTI